MIIYIAHNRIEFVRLSGKDMAIEDVLRYESLEDVKATVEDRIQQANSPLTILLSGCFAFAQPLSPEKRIKSNKSAIGFGVEEFLPLAAEQLNADFVRDTDLVVAAHDKPFLDWLESLGKPGRGTFVGLRPILATQWLLKKNRLPANGRVLLVSDDEFDLVTIGGGKILQWKWTPDRHGIDQELALTNDGRPLTAYGSHILSLDDLPIEFEDRRSITPSIMELAFDMSERIRTGRDYPLASVPELDNIKKPGLERTYAFLVFAIAIVLIGVAAFFYTRKVQLHALTAKIDQEITTVYEMVIPGGRPGPMALRKLNAKLQALKSLDAEFTKIENRPQILSELQRILLALPDDSNYSLDRISIDQSGIELSGQHFEEASFGQFAAALASHGFELNSNRGGATRRTEHGKNFRFRSGLRQVESNP